MRDDYKKIAVERIRHLLALARKNKQKSKRYISLAEKIGMKSRVKIPKDLKIQYCRKCKTLFTNKTLKVRTKKGFLVYECLACGNIKRYKIK